ncbi:uncharacterized protein LOC124371371 [Homalodisca vitripennis]|uniref:uncharacterized protein LOC124371371 n=1 Tax=Homalodisca vitripennis TaxID=197043 RepID=UPI001EE9AFA9|nr:uncharacterized protein LOC124371371 [Homalodisca vitripennis]
MILLVKLPVNCLLFADDLKIYTRVHSTFDQQVLQRSLTRIETWCAANVMELNVSKCEVVSFSRSRFPYIFDYRINGLLLRRVNSVKNLGVVFTSTLDPLEHIDGVVSRAYSLLGFIMRSTRSFRSPQSLLILYKTLVRPSLSMVR